MHGRSPVWTRLQAPAALWTGDGVWGEAPVAGGGGAGAYSRWGPGRNPGGSQYGGWCSGQIPGGFWACVSRDVIWGEYPADRGGLQGWSAAVPGSKTWSPSGGSALEGGDLFPYDGLSLCGMGARAFLPPVPVGPRSLVFFFQGRRQRPFEMRSGHHGAHRRG